MYDEKTDLSTNNINLRPKLIYGLRTDVKGNIHFNLEQEVIYPIEGVIAFHDFVAKKQSFLRLPEDVEPLIIEISPHRKLLAILEQSKTGGIISIYELHTLKKCRVLDVPLDITECKIVQMNFTVDSRGLVLLTAGPNEKLFVFSLDKTGTVLECHPAPPGTRGTLECLACNTYDTTVFGIGGNQLLMLIAKSEKGFNTNVNLKLNYHVTSLAFLASDTILIGTSNDLLMVVENGDLKFQLKASEAEIIDLLLEQDAINRDNENRIIASEKLTDTRVVCMTAFTHGVAFAIFNKLFVFERVSEFKFERKTILTVPPTIYSEALYQITNVAIDSKEETVIVTTKHAQIYVGILIVPETLKAKQLKFTPLGALIHIDEIVDVSMCSWKPIIMTASKDQTIRIWNYETETVELVRKFQVDVNIVELHLTGLMAAIGFADQLRITQIFMDELNIVKTYNFPRCKAVKYSNFGHFMAAAFDNIVAITSVFNLEVLNMLKAHNGIVLSICWSSTDKYLFSGGAEGAIYQWEVETGTRVQEIVEKGTEYLSICCTHFEPMSVYAATSSGLLREFVKAELTREIAIPSKYKSRLTNVAIARSSLIMFLSNIKGNLINVKLPFLEAGGGACTNFRFFVNCINKILFSYDGTLLVAISKGGTLAVWALENIAGKVAPMDQDLLRSQEVLIPRSILSEKNEQIVNLELRLKQQAEEFQYQMSQNEIFDGQQLAEVHKSYCHALEELKRINNEIEDRHTEEMNQITFQISDLKEEHKRQLNNLATQYSERMLIEYQKFTKLRQSMLELRENYEGKLKKSAGTLQDTVEGLESDYKKQLDERKELIRNLMKEMEDKKTEFIEFCRQVEVENDRNMVETQLKYEVRLTTERNECQLWRGRTGVLQKKYDSLTRDVDNLLEEVETLKEEHNKNQKNIAKLNRTIEDLQKDISDRDYAIGAKEKRIQDLMHKNQELDKYKQVLNHKIAELKAQIEPREFQINDKRKHIMEMERELAGLNQNNIQLELQLKELKDKYISNLSELKMERHRARAGRECVQNLCTEIYNTANLVSDPGQLQVAVKDMFLRHASDNELKRFISLDAKVRDEFQRQRHYIEGVLKIFKNRAEIKNERRRYDKLFNENAILMQEIDKMRAENEMLRMHLKKNVPTVNRRSKKRESKIILPINKA